MKIKSDELILDIFIFMVMVWVAVITLYPFLNVLAISLNDASDTIKGTGFIIPRVFTFDNYITIFTNKTSNLPHATLISVLRTVIGSVATVFCTTMLAYTLSRKDYVFKKFIDMMLLVTMYIGGGMIPTYMLIRNLGLLGSFWVYIIPGLIGAFNVILIKSFIRSSIPDSLEESARLDGANDFVIFTRIVLPLCTPVIATMLLLSAVGQWNSWFDTYIYGQGKKEIFTLQYELMKILADTSNIMGTSSPQSATEMQLKLEHSTVSPESIKMAITMVATAPILLVYPFVQKYFVTGLTIGAVKS